MKAINLTTGVEQHFDNATTQEYAVRYGYAEEHNMLSLFFRLTQDGDVAGLERFFPTKKTKMLGRATIGDWVAVPSVDYVDQ